MQGQDGQDGENFVDWYCAIREKDINNLTWEDICIDIVQSAEINDGNGKSTSLWDVIFAGMDIAEIGGTAYTLSSCKASIATLQGEIGALQSQIFVVQGAVGAILSSTITDNTIDAFDEIVDTAQSALDIVNGSSGSSIFQSIGNLASRISSAFSRLRPSINTAASSVNRSVLHESLLGTGMGL